MKTILLNVFTRNRVLHIQPLDNGKVHIVIGTDKQNKGVIGNARQYLANVIYRFADLIHPRDYDGRGVAIIERLVLATTPNDLMPQVTQDYAAKRLPSDRADGHTDYNGSLIDETIQRHDDATGPLGSGINRIGQKAAYHLHEDFLKGKKIEFWESNTSAKQRNQSIFDWLVAVVAVMGFLVLAGWMGTDQAEDQLLSAQVLDDIKKSNTQAMLNPAEEMAELDLRARDMTSYERITLAEGK